MKRIYAAITLTILLLACEGCMNASKPAPATTPQPSVQTPVAPASASASASESTSAPVRTQNASFSNFEVPDTFQRLGELKDDTTNPDAVYMLYEYAVKEPLSSVDQWLREEARRLGGKVTERYGYNADNLPELIIELPSKTGTKIVSIYALKYGDEQHLVVLESSFKKPTVFNQDTEDHALVIFTPHETFKANYEHEHTDIYALYFYSQAFFKQLKEEDYLLLKSEPDYTVGYFDSKGNEVGYDQITPENKRQYTFGIQLNTDFLPEDGHQRKLLLSCWAQTLLMGNKALTAHYELSSSITFLQKGQHFAHYTLENMLKTQQ